MKPDTQTYVTAKTLSKLNEEHGDRAPSISEIEGTWTNLVRRIQVLYPEFELMGGAELTRNQLKKYRKQMTSSLIGGFIQGATRKERASATNVRYQYCVEVPLTIRTEQLLLNALVRHLVMESSQVVTLEQKAQHIIQELFALLIQKGNAEKLLPEDWREVFKDCEADERVRVICDYISGMTDLYAQRMYARLFHPFAGSVYEVL